MADVNKIILDLEVREGNIKQRIESLNESIKKATQGSDSYELSLKKLQQAEIKLAETSARLQTAKTNLGNSMHQASKAMQQTSDKTGAATSAVLELGRVVQDAPYGIRGMANNITQLVSQFSFATVSAGGFTAALKQMWAAMLGPLGIVLAISAVVSLLDGLYGGQKKAEESSNELNESLKGLSETLRDNFVAQSDINDKIEEYIELIDLKAISEKKSEKNAEKILELQEKVEKSQDRLNKLQKVRNSLIQSEKDGKLVNFRQKMLEVDRQILLMESKVIEQKKERNDAIKQNLQLIKDVRDAANKLNEADADSLKGLKTQKSELEKRRGVLSKTSEDYKRLTIDIDNVQKKIEEIEGKQSKAKTGGGGGTQRDRVKALFDFPTPAEVLAYSKKLLAAVARGFGVDMKQNPLSIKPELDLTLSDDAKAKIAAYNKSVVDELMLSMKLDDFAKYSELTKQALTSISDFTNAQYERDLVTEQNKTTALNEELNQRLLNENLSKEERARIQNEIAINDEALRKKQNEIKKKQFNTQKAFNIASALVDTGRAAAGVMADAKGGFFTRLAQAIPTIAFGLAQVATIASQKFQPDAASTPIRTSGSGGSGGGMADRSFNFNLVGNNRENQLANAIQGQFNQPLKAYVVSRDMSNQQQLDANIVDSARF